MEDALEKAVDRAWHETKVQAAVRAERDRCAKIAETEEELDGEPTTAQLDAMHLVGPVENARAAVRATKKSIAARIRAANGHG